jgi:hypothetical protein
MVKNGQQIYSNLLGVPHHPFHMRYLCMVFFDEKKLDALSDDEWRAFEAATRACEENLRRSGHFIAAQALQSVQVATTVRVRNGRVSVTDGPFAETNEQLGGFSVIEAPGMNEAIALASTIPAADLGGVEVRPMQ